MKAPKKGFTRELQVGLFVIMALAIMAAFAFRITKSPIWRTGYTLVAYFDDSVGMFKNSPVKMAGIDIGFIEKIELDEGKAKITMLIHREGLKIPKNAVFYPRPLGFLGDKFIEVQIPKDSELDESSAIWRVIDYALLNVGHFLMPSAHAQASGNYKGGEVVKTQTKGAGVDDVIAQINVVANDLNVISTTLKEALVDGGKINSPVGEIVKNLVSLTGNLDHVVNNNQSDLRGIVSSFKEILSTVKRVVKSVDDGKIGQNIQELVNSVGKVGKTVNNLEDITSKINQGDGTLGRLVNDGSTIEELNRTLRGINSFFNKNRRTKIMLDLYPEYLLETSDTKTYVSLMLKPNEDYGYILQIVSDPVGETKTIIEEKTINGGTPTITETKTTEKNKFKISAQLYKRIYDLSFRVGLFESAGGVGVDYYLWKDRIQWSVDAFDFGRENDSLFLKSNIKVYFLQNFYISVGAHDILSDNNNESFLVGAGLRFDDNYISSIVTLLSL